MATFFTRDGAPYTGPESTVAKMVASDAAKAASRHVGKVGERISATVTVERVSFFDRPQYGAEWRTETVWIVTMRDESTGAAIVSKSPRFHREQGERLAIKATVKEHGEFRGEQQTVVQRIKVAA